ncbi:hypothetical protein O3M35_000279 [Rhynocoris fuscipes]|uniref:Uncharacterized protein n=1 Tax=Rhynocoris fuscipes TaxID=488301 RepID=A0AAW1DPL6_9HEMI
MVAIFKVLPAALCIVAVSAGLIEPDYYSASYEDGYLDGGHYGASPYIAAAPYSGYIAQPAPAVHYAPSPAVHVSPAPAVHYSAAPLPVAAPVAAVAPVPTYEGVEYASYAPHHDHEHYSYPKYAFEYGVNDPHTGDIKSQYEERDGDVVKGSYSLVEPDGTVRVVEYTADDHNGFNAVVKKIGVAHHPTHVAAAPIAHIPAPVAHVSPVPAAYGLEHSAYHYHK